MTSLGKPITQRQLRVGEMIKQALGLLFIRDEAKLFNLSTKEITVTEADLKGKWSAVVFYPLLTLHSYALQSWGTLLITMTSYKKWV